MTATLATDVSGGGGTTTIGYPTGTSAADFSAGGRHTVQIGGDDYFFSYRGEVSLSFGASDITITNISGQDWGTGQMIRIGLDQDTLTTNSIYESPATAPLPKPLGGSPALTSQGGITAHDNILGETQSMPASRGAH